MAVLADIGCIDVIGVFACNIDAVVTGKAIARNAGMIEDGRNPERTVMTVVAVVARRNVARRLAGGSGAIVTGTAAPRHSHMVHVEDRAPGRCGVAAIAGFRGCDVAWGLHRRQHGAYLRMASDTGRIGTFKDTAGVATVAGNILMRTIQVKASGEVVKRFLRGCGSTQQQGTQ